MEKEEKNNLPEVHQIELEIQKEELRRAEEKATTIADKFTAMYDFAPLGYFALDCDGKICELNLNGAKLVGKERSLLVNSNFRLFVQQDTLTVFNDFLGKVFATNCQHTCEAKLTTKDNPLMCSRFRRSEHQR
jgi:hypothetical protein